MVANILNFPQTDTTEAEIVKLQSSLGDWTPPTNEEWIQKMNPLLPSLRMAWMLVTKKTKPELSDVKEALDPEALNELMYQLWWAASYFEKLANLLRGAEARLVAHGVSPACDSDLERRWET